MKKEFNSEDIDFAFLEDIKKLIEIASGDLDIANAVLTVHQGGDVDTGFDKGYVISVNPQRLDKPTQLQIEALVARLADQ